MSTKRCAIIGSTPDELEFGYDEEYPSCVEMKAALAMKLLDLIREGCSSYISSLEQGAEIWGAEACMSILALGGKIELICIPTSENQANLWHPTCRERYFNLLENCTTVIEPKSGKSSEDYIIENADLLLILGKKLGKRALEIEKRAEENGIRICRVG
jgi:uncharacterized phage-like protein YoqJ